MANANVEYLLDPEILWPPLRMLGRDGLKPCWCRTRTRMRFGKERHFTFFVKFDGKVDGCCSSLDDATSSCQVKVRAMMTT
jgi:hypothetical protein